MTLVVAANMMMQKISHKRQDVTWKPILFAANYNVCKHQLLAYSYPIFLINRPLLFSLLTLE